MGWGGGLGLWVFPHAHHTEEDTSKWHRHVGELSQSRAVHAEINLLAFRVPQYFALNLPLSVFLPLNFCLYGEADELRYFFGNCLMEVNVAVVWRRLIQS